MDIKTALMSFLMSDVNLDGLTSLAPVEDEDVLRAAQKGEVEEMRSLLGRGALIGKHILSLALLYSVMEGSAECAGLLLNSGADANFKNEVGETVLMLAVAQQREDIVRMLLARGADARTKSDNGNTAMDWAKKLPEKTILGLLG